MYHKQIFLMNIFVPHGCSWHVVAQKSFQLARKHFDSQDWLQFQSEIEFPITSLACRQVKNRIHYPDSKIH